MNEVEKLMVDLLDVTAPQMVIEILEDIEERLNLLAESEDSFSLEMNPGLVRMFQERLSELEHGELVPLCANIRYYLGC
tara:strand:+ start:118047 stop:118283 length:237 start_codon:yes stop_codon:yes gene_type:complete